MRNAGANPPGPFGRGAAAKANHDRDRAAIRTAGFSAAPGRISRGYRRARGNRSNRYPTAAEARLRADVRSPAARDRRAGRVYNYYKPSDSDPNEHRASRKQHTRTKKRAPVLRQGPNGGWMRGLCVPFNPLDGRPSRKVCQMFQAPSFRRTTSFITFPSAARPASLGITAFITRPRSFPEVAPDSRMASSTARSISAGSMGGGR